MPTNGVGAGPAHNGATNGSAAQPSMLTELDRIDEALDARSAEAAAADEVIRMAEAKLREGTAAGADAAKLAKLAEELDRARIQVADFRRKLASQRTQAERLRSRVQASEEVALRLRAVHDQGVGLETVLAAERLAIRRSKLLLAAQVGALVLVVGSILAVAPSTGAAARSDFYLAAAGILPLLLVAGFVELSALASVAISWAAIGVRIPRDRGRERRSAALANGTARFPSLALTCYGLAATVVTLLVLAAVHDALGRSGRPAGESSEIVIGGASAPLEQEIGALAQTMNEAGNTLA